MTNYKKYTFFLISKFTLWLVYNISAHLCSYYSLKMLPKIRCPALAHVPGPTCQMGKTNNAQVSDKMHKRSCLSSKNDEP